MQIRGINMIELDRKYTWGAGLFEYVVRAVGTNALGVYCVHTGKYLEAATALHHLLSVPAIEDFRYV